MAGKFQTCEPRNIQICIKIESVFKKLLWISLQKDNSISIGFLDRAFHFPGFTSERELDGIVKREFIDLEAKHDAKAIRNPHFTFHPPGFWHLRSGNNLPLLSGLVWTEPGPGETESPWIRFVSNPIKDLSPFEGKSTGNTIEVHSLLANSVEDSVAIHFDFIKKSEAKKIGKPNISKFINWGDVTLHLYSYTLPGQSAWLGYLIKG